jgi:endonuclease IV
MSSRKITYVDSDYRYGFHVNKASTLTETIEKVSNETSFSNFQTYIGNPRSNSSSKCDIEDIMKSRDLLKLKDLKMFIHGCLLYNLCGAPNHRKDSKFNYNIDNTSMGLTIELDIAAGLGAQGVVVHPNSCHDVDKGLSTASKIIEFVLTKNTNESKTLSKRLGISNEKFKKTRRLLLENSAHEGGKRGWNLEELGRMIRGVPLELQSQIGVCIDTAHAYGAGIYDFGIISDIEKFYEDFEKEIGLKHLWLFHLNDSKHSTTKKAENAYFGSHKDRHENLGLGYIFGDSESLYTEISYNTLKMEALKEFFILAYKHKIPIIGEPPASSQGSSHDWKISKNILMNSEYPLEL